MSASDRFQWSNLICRIRYEESVSVQTLCQDLLACYNQDLRTTIPAIFNLTKQSWKPSMPVGSSWASGIFHMTNTSFVTQYEENTLALGILYSWKSPEYKINNYRCIVWCGENEDFSDAYITWSE